MKRGTRNKNPGNIKLTSLSWRGKVPNSENTDGTFEQFTEMPFGIRALYRLLVTYVNKYKLRSVDDIIDRYAPSGEKARRITDLSDLKTLKPIVEVEEKKKFPAKPILADIALAAFFVNIFSRK
jgi:hypothetical protein